MARPELRSLRAVDTKALIGRRLALLIGSLWDQVNDKAQRLRVA